MEFHSCCAFALQEAQDLMGMPNVGKGLNSTQNVVQ